MKNIEILSLKDFDCLRNLKGTETIHLYLKKAISESKIDSIDLSDFQGTIHVHVLNNNLYKLHVLTSSKINHWIFSNCKKNQVILDNLGFFITSYQKIPFEFFIQSEEDFWQLPKLLRNHSVINVELLCDIFCENSSVLDLADYNGYFSFDGKGYTIYNLQGIKDLESQMAIHTHNCKFLQKNLEFSFFPAEEVYKIYQLKDFEQLKELRSSNVCIILQNDIKKGTCPSIDLSRYHGIILFLGSNKTIHQIKTKSHHNTAGLFTELPYESGFITHDLNMDCCYITNNKDNPFFSGAILSHKKVCSNDAYSSGSGKVEFKNCTVSNSFFHGKYVGPFIGVIQSDVDFIRCNSINNYHVLNESEKQKMASDCMALNTTSIQTSNNQDVCVRTLKKGDGYAKYW